jgi:hypothetical protein
VQDDAPEHLASLDPSDPESWKLTMLVCDQVIRHLRVVGNGLAWRLFNYDRRKILALSSKRRDSALLAAEVDHTFPDGRFAVPGQECRGA